MNKKCMNRTTFIEICTALATMSIIVSNIITNKQIDFFGYALPCASLLIPIDYVIGDLVAEVYGFHSARRIIVLAFAMDALAVAFFCLALALPGFSTFNAQGAFETVLGTTPRVLAASLAAFIIGSLSNAKIMQIMHARDGENKLAWRCIASTIVGETLDMTVFVVLAFSGVLPTDIIGQIILLNSLVKVAIECILYAFVTRHVIGWAKKLG